MLDIAEKVEMHGGVISEEDGWKYFWKKNWDGVDVPKSDGELVKDIKDEEMMQKMWCDESKAEIICLCTV